MTEEKNMYSTCKTWWYFQDIGEPIYHVGFQPNHFLAQMFCKLMPWQKQLHWKGGPLSDPCGLCYRSVTCLMKLPSLTSRGVVEGGAPEKEALGEPDYYMHHVKRFHGPYPTWFAQSMPFPSNCSGSVVKDLVPVYLTGGGSAVWDPSAVRWGELTYLSSCLPSGSKACKCK